jgi:hypothetical protein
VTLDDVGVLHHHGILAWIDGQDSAAFAGIFRPLPHLVAFANQHS